MVWDEKENAKQVTNGSEGFSLMSKEKILKSNVLELLKAKGANNNDSVSYLLDNYFNELDTWINASKIIKENAKEDTLNYTPEIQGYLDLQHKVLKDHKVELIKQFGFWKIKIELERLSTFTKSSKLITTNNNKALIVNKQSNDNSKTKSKINNKKQPLIKEREVDNYLLKNVFNFN